MKRISAAAGTLLLAACTTSSITPQTDVMSQQSYTAVALGDITVPDPMWAPEADHFRHGFVNRLKETNVFARVAEHPDPASAADAITVSGAITDIDKGNKALRVIIGLGAGREKIEGAFQIAGPDGTVYAHFSSAKAYSGGAGIGGFDLLDIDDVMEKYGADTADAVVRWSQGKKIDGSN